MNPDQLLNHIIVPTLKMLDPVIPYSNDAAILLLGTAAQESNCGHEVKQVGGGPAVGIFQMEPKTIADILVNYLKYREDKLLSVLNMSFTARDSCGIELSDFVRKYNNGIAFGRPKLIDSLNSEFMMNPMLACAFARVQYYRVSEPLPSFHDDDAFAWYWKKHYNTHSGKGTVDEYINNFDRLSFVLDYEGCYLKCT